MTDILKVEDLKIEFRLHDAGIVEAVRGVSFRVPEAGTVALVGESGSGKSVISRAILGILPQTAKVTAGRILYRDPLGKGAVTDIVALGQDSAELRAIRGGRISMIFQEPMTSLSPLHTIGNQVGEALQLHREVSKSQARELSREILEMVGFPDPAKALDTYPFELSGGLRQRAMIAAALVCHPALLVADEPTTALDVTIQAQILKLIRELQSELQMALLLITHDLGVVANVAEEVVVVYHGQLMESGRLRDIYHRPEHPYLRALLKAVPRLGMETGERLTPIREIHTAAAELHAGEDTPPIDGEGDSMLLKVSSVSKRFGTRKRGFFAAASESDILALNDVSLEIRRGECLGLVGESGCGKTTLSKVIMRALSPDAGQVLFNNAGEWQDLTALNDTAMIPLRKKIQFVFQDPFGSLNPRMTVYDIVSEPLVIHDIGTGNERREKVKRLMTAVGLDPRFLSRYPHSFSGGQRQRIGIARALALNPELLICDEPVSALDVSVQAQILNLLKNLQTELGLTYLFISHNLAVVDYMADRIAVMCAGHLVEVAPRELLFKKPLHPYTKTLLAAVPKTDPDNPLDFSQLMEGKSSDPAFWTGPFAAVDGCRPHLVDLGSGHFVRATDSIISEVTT